MGRYFFYFCGCHPKTRREVERHGNPGKITFEGIRSPIGKESFSDLNCFRYVAGEPPASEVENELGV